MPTGTDMASRLLWRCALTGLPHRPQNDRFITSPESELVSSYVLSTDGSVSVIVTCCYIYMSTFLLSSLFGLGENGENRVKNESGVRVQSDTGYGGRKEMKPGCATKVGSGSTVGQLLNIRWSGSRRTTQRHSRCTSGTTRSSTGFSRMARRVSRF